MACEKFLAEVLRPRFLPEVRPSARFNYPVAIDGKWHGNKYRFFTRYRSDDSSSLTEEFDAPFARLDYVSRNCFDLMWHRHTGEWFRLFERLSLTEALHRIEADAFFSRVELTAGTLPPAGPLLATPEFHHMPRKATATACDEFSST